ncbi:hypothetical protein C9J49_007775 [Halomonas sp. SL1]|nr:hypothetical protein C9J49_007775 [Halomonas sp. SL1]
MIEGISLSPTQVTLADLLLIRNSGRTVGFEEMIYITTTSLIQGDFQEQHEFLLFIRCSSQATQSV